VGRILSGWERCVEARDSAGIDEIRAGIRICRSIGATLDDPLFLAILAEALLALDRPGEAAIALDEALTIVRSTRSFFYDAEIQRLRGVVCLKMDRDDCRASELFRSAVETARRQGAPMLALRSAVSLANLPGGDVAEGREVLQQLLPDLREGAGLAEIQQARAILSRAVSLP
jgi:predicted ATPase